MVVRMFAGGWSFTSMGILAAAAVLAGCSTNHPRPDPTKHASQAAASSQPAKVVAADPAAIDPMRLMRDVLARCEALQGYEIVFHRQERRGLLSPKLGEWEDMRVNFRKQPHSIKMAWLNADSEYIEAVYIDGVNDGKVTVLPRKGLFGLPGSPVSVAPELAVQMGKSLRPINDFGLAEMVRRTLSRLDEAKGAGGATLTYEGQVPVEKLGTRAHHLVVRYPKGFGQAARQDLYINVETGYPDGAYLWLANGELMAAYLYEKPVVATQSDSVFTLAKGKQLAEKS